MDYLTTHTNLSPIWRGFAPGFVNYKKGCTRLAAASDKVYQLLAHGRWFSPGTPASSTTKTGRHEIAEILLKVALKHQKSIIHTSKHYEYVMKRNGENKKIKSDLPFKTILFKYDMQVNYFYYIPDFILFISDYAFPYIILVLSLVTSAAHLATSNVQVCILFSTSELNMKVKHLLMTQLLHLQYAFSTIITFLHY